MGTQEDLISILSVATDKIWAKIWVQLVGRALQMLEPCVHFERICELRGALISNVVSLEAAMEWGSVRFEFDFCPWLLTKFGPNLGSIGALTSGSEDLYSL